MLSHAIPFHRLHGAARLCGLIALAALAMGPTRSEAVPITTNLVGYWQLNENPASNGTAISALYGAGGTLSTDNGATNKSVVGQVGRALDLDGVNDGVNLGNQANLTPGMSSFSISLWFKADAITGNHFMFMKGNVDNSADEGWSVFRESSTGGLFFRINSSNTTSERAWITTNAFTDTTSWHHVVGIVNRSTNRISGYLDGVAFTNASNLNTLHPSDTTDISGFGSIDPTSDNAWIGNNTGVIPTADWNGKLDEVAFWRRALTTNEVQSIYQKGLAGFSFLVPEPGSITLLALGFLGLAAFAYRRNRSSQGRA